MGAALASWAVDRSCEGEPRRACPGSSPAPDTSPKSVHVDQIRAWGGGYVNGGVHAPSRGVAPGGGVRALTRIG